MNRMGSLLISRHLTILWKRTQWRSLTSSISPEHAIPPLVSTSWLQSQLSSPSIVPIDASFAYNSLVQVDDDEIVEAPPVHDYSVDYLKGHIEVRLATIASVMILMRSLIMIERPLLSF